MNDPFLNHLPYVLDPLLLGFYVGGLECHRERESAPTPSVLPKQLSACLLQAPSIMFDTEYLRGLFLLLFSGLYSPRTTLLQLEQGYDRKMQWRWVQGDF